MDGTASTRAHDNDGLRVPANKKARSGGPEKKESQGRHLNPACQQSAKPSLIAWRARRQAIALTAKAVCLNQLAKFCQSSAKVCGHLTHRDFQSSEIDHGSVALIGFLVAGGDAPECFEAAEEILDEVSPTVGVEVAVDFSLPV